MIGVVSIVLFLIRDDKRLAERRQQIEQEAVKLGFGFVAAAAWLAQVQQFRGHRSDRVRNVLYGGTRAGACYFFESP